MCVVRVYIFPVEHPLFFIELNGERCLGCVVDGLANTQNEKVSRYSKTLTLPSIILFSLSTLSIPAYLTLSFIRSCHIL